MKISCPTCSTPIPTSQINVATDVALCAACEEAFSIAALIAAGQAAQEFETLETPTGVWFDETYGGWRLGSTTRSPIAFFLVPFMCVWSGFSLGGIYGKQIMDGEFNLMMSLFGIPFLLGTLVFGYIAVMSVCGKISITVDGNSGKLFEGVGPIGRTRHFDWSSITRIEEAFLGNQHASGNQAVLVLVGARRWKFGATLRKSRHDFLLESLRKLLAARSVEDARIR